MDILHLIASDSFITVNKALIKSVGLEAAVIVGELASEHNYWQQNNGITEEGYFFSTIENIEDKTSLSEHKQRQALKKLEELGVVSVKVKGLPAKRYVKLNPEQLMELFQNKEKSISETSSGNFQELAPENFNRNNNIINNNISIINNMEETSSSETCKETSPNEFFEEETINNDAPPSPPPAVKSKKITVKDQLTNFVNDSQLTHETKDVLLKWIFNIGLPKGVRLEQLKDMLTKIWKECNGNESLVRESIENSYLHNWFGFYPSKVSKPTSSHNNPAQPCTTPSTPIQPRAIKLGEVF